MELNYNKKLHAKLLKQKIRMHVEKSGYYIDSTHATTETNTYSKNYRQPLQILKLAAELMGLEKQNLRRKLFDDLIPLITTKRGRKPTSQAAEDLKIARVRACVRKSRERERSKKRRRRAQRKRFCE